MTPLNRIKSLLTVTKDCSLLKEWDVQFLESLETQLRRGRTLSVRQNDFLQKIEAKLSPAALQSASEWKESWDATKKATARRCAEYYRTTDYFSYIANRVLDEPEWVVPQAQYEKMCENKYAKKILATLDAPSLYPAGAAVMLRATAHQTMTRATFTKFKEKPLFVLEVLPTVRSAAKGAKLYKVLSGTSTDVFEIEERFLKVYRKMNRKEALERG